MTSAEHCCFNSRVAFFRSHCYQTHLKSVRIAPQSWLYSLPSVHIPWGSCSFQVVMSFFGLIEEYLGKSVPTMGLLLLPGRDVILWAD